MGLGSWCVTPLSTIFQLYCSGQFYWWRKLEYPEKTTDIIPYYCIKFTKVIQQLEGIKQINHNLDKPTRGSHEPLSLTWKGRFIELLHMVAYLNFEIPGFQSNRPLVIYRYKIEFSSVNGHFRVETTELRRMHVHSSLLVVTSNQNASNKKKIV